MSKLSIFLGSYFSAGLMFWISYILLRPHVHKSNKHFFLFIANLILGITLVTILPVYLYLSGAIQNPVGLLLAGIMGISAVLHHIAILKDTQQWHGLITPLGLKIPMIHGAITHLLFSISYIIYGFLLLDNYLGKTELLSETIFLFTFVSLIEFAGTMTFYNGIRMCFLKRK